MHEGPTENRLGELGSLYKYYYYYYYYHYYYHFCDKSYLINAEFIALDVLSSLLDRGAF